MVGELRHRGPDGTGLLIDGGLAVASARLAIVDLEGGDQPLSDERGRFWAMQNGEIYNYVEVRTELRELGHRFTTESDTEVIAHAYEEWGVDCLRRFNGDFAIAVWDRVRRELFLARDRFGVRPLFLAEYGGDVCFASEAKALLRHPAAARELDPVGIVDAFTLWSTLPDRSSFPGIRQLPPAHYALIGPEGLVVQKRWWDLEFAPQAAGSDVLDELEALLVDATRLRLRADVPVGAYLSGGLDSSAVAAIAAREAGTRLFAFGLGFADDRFDERSAQERIVSKLRVDFHGTVVDAPAIGRLLPRAVELGETPLLRTAPAPLLGLSAAVRDAGLHVVLTGEGADELFAGYDIFREDKVRRFWARDPSSRLRPLLFQRLNRFLAADTSRAPAFLAGFYGRGLLDLDNALYSHRIRFSNSARCLRILHPDLLRKAAEATAPPTERLLALLPERFGSMSPLGRAQYLEIVTFLQGYLLHAQGDRMLMGNSVEGRFPYLDHRVAEFAARLPDGLRLRGLEEKYALRAAVSRYLPPDIRARPKQPYRAPIGEALIGPAAAEEVRQLLTERPVKAAGLLDPFAVERLVRKFEPGRPVSETDEMALVGAASLMLLHERFVATPKRPSPLEPSRVVVEGEVASNATPVVETV
jgi:asparagine synthase (glutamine-hydrolysing)